MKLQLALDATSLTAALSVMEATADLVDIIEVGTPLVLHEGAAAVREMKRRWPRLLVLADFKIMDAGDLEARVAFDAGADIVTVLAVAETETVRRACGAARAAGRSVMVDMIAVKNSAARAGEMLDAGCDYLCCHTAYDVQSAGHSPLSSLKLLREAAPRARIAVAGGVTPERIAALIAYGPEIVIVGGYVANAKDPRAAVQAVRAAFG
jgi:3-hexulose-6-phosphate synthase